MKLNKKITAAMVTVAALFGSVAQADTTTGSFKVATDVAATCSLELEDIEVGEFIAQQTGVTTKTSNVAGICSKDVIYTISYNSASGNNAAKTMTDGKGNTLKYSLKSRRGITRFEVSELQAGSNYNMPGTGERFTFPLNLEIDNNQFVAPGVYTDTITVTVTY